jgi:hypothetical protein
MEPVVLIKRNRLSLISDLTNSLNHITTVITNQKTTKRFSRPAAEEFCNDTRIGPSIRSCPSE